jgi:hypothetical protein
MSKRSRRAALLVVVAGAGAAVAAAARDGRPMPRAAAVVAAHEARELAASAYTPSAACASSAYYAGVQGVLGKQDTSSAELMAALRGLLAGGAPSSVSSVQALSEAVQRVDSLGGDLNSTQVRLVDSGLAAPKVSQGGNAGWARGQLVPSVFGIYESGADAFDLFNVRAVNETIAARRLNKVFGWCESEAVCARPAAVGAPFEVSMDPLRFTPAASMRGDVARAVLYMAVRYSAPGTNESKLELTNCPALPTGAAGERFLFGSLAQLLEWHRADPVDEAERVRNDVVCSEYQHNRNPFVDIPALADRVFCSGNGYADPVAGCKAVASPACGGSCGDVGGLSFADTNENVTCAALKGANYCEYSLVVRQRCKASCGMCTGPVCADAVPSGLVWDDSGADIKCADMAAFCSEAYVVDACPATCGACSAATFNVPNSTFLTQPPRFADNTAAGVTTSSSTIVFAVVAACGFVALAVGVISQFVFNKRASTEQHLQHGGAVVPADGMTSKSSYDMRENRTYA